MKRLLLSCDDYIYCHNGKYYAANQEKAEFYLRYLRVFDSLRLVARCINEPQIKNNRVLLDNRIECIPIPMFQGPKQYAKVYFAIDRLLSDVTNGCDAAILRLPSTIAIRVYDKVRQSRIPYATEIVYDAYDGYTSSSSIVHKILWLCIDKKMQKICYDADGVSCVTAYHLQQRYYTKKVNGFTSNYSSLALPKSFYGAPRIYPRGKVLSIAHVANQIEYAGRKGHIELITAVANLKQLGLNVNVFFAGKDYFCGQNRLEELAKRLGVSENIKFVGYLDRKQLDEYLCSADLFVLPTRAEGLPRVIIEAMAKGLPCISTNVSGIPELLNKQWLIRYNDITTLAELIKKLSTDAELYEKTSAENFKNSCAYEASILERRRDAFYTQLKNCIK